MWWRRLAGTASARLAALSAAAITVAALLPILLIYYQVSVLLTQRIDRFLERQAAEATPAVRAALLRRVNDGIEDDLHRISVAGLFDAARRPLAGNLRALPPSLPLDGRAHAVAAAGFGNPAWSSSMPLRVVGRVLPDGTAFVIGSETWALSEIRATASYVVFLWLAPIILLAFATGLWLTRRAMAHVRDLQRSTQRIIAGDLTERLRIDGRDDDIDRLAGSINSMLDEIEHLVEQVRAVGNDIAHGLRTPLARMKTRLDRMRTEPADRAALAAALDAMAAELTQTLRIVTALLRLAEIDGRSRRGSFADIDLHAVASETVAFYEPLAASRDIVLTASGGTVRVRGDADLLSEALANLVDNAIKFTPPGGRIDVAAEAEAARATLRVRDSGPGIRAEERGRVLDRFYRAEATRHLPGTGLGLALVAAIMRLHGGAVSVGDNAPGAAFELSLPRADGSA